VKTATTRDQYSGLNCSGVSTIINLIGRMGSTEGRTREICRIDADELDVAMDESGGVYMPDSRNDLMFDMRSKEEADGDRSMIGSGRRAEAFGFIASAGLLARFELADC